MTISQSVSVPPETETPATGGRSAAGPRTALFAVTAFLGAALLFVVQPLVAKLILPSYGGSATVWSTSSLFFQVLLLAAYGYAHWSTSRLGARWQPRAHLVVLCLPLVALPLAIPGNVAPSADASPVLWLLRTLVLVIGLPFAVVATTGPLLQRWYSWGDHHRSEDPYFLFAASNLGSFGGLLAYPLLIEPHLTLAAQRSWWTIGFLGFVVLTAACALSVRGTSRASTPEPEQVSAGPRPGRSQVLTWIALAFLPSSLMLGVTAHISTDIAAIPLLWVVPLAIYLATFVLAFARTSRVPPRRVTQLAVAVTFVVVVTLLLGTKLPVTVSIGLNLVMLALVAYAAHARLAVERPATEHLTAFYLVVATGGALGGLLNGLVAPMVFDRILEYPLALIVVPLLLVGVRRKQGGSSGPRGLPAPGLLARGAVVLTAPLVVGGAIWKASSSPMLVVVLVCVALAVGWWMAFLPRTMAIALVLFFAAGAVGEAQGVLLQTRTFFGSYSVIEKPATNELVHGTTVHGTQFREAARRGTPTTYYSRSGPLGAVFADREQDSVAVVGLGAGTVAAYGQPGQQMTFYEIDPEIVRIARDPRLFTYLADSDADVETVVGDGRLGIAEAPRDSFDTIILDAFSSDSIPVHLLTVEAMRTYLDRLAPGGLLVVHISNRMFDLEPVLAGAADSLDLAAAIGRSEGDADGGAPSVWVALAQKPEDLASLRSTHGWQDLGPDRSRWTDDYSSILSVLR